MTRHAFITGASSGIGEHLARTLAGRDCDLALAARRTDRLEKLADEIRAAHPGRRVLPFALDVTDPVAVREVMLQADRELGGLDLVVANAGLGSQSEGFIGHADHPERVARLIATNVAGALATLATGVELFWPRGRGHLVAMSSVAGTRGLPWSPAYSASKAALDTYAEGIRANLCETDIDVTVIKPGYIQTEIFDDAESLPNVVPVEEAIGPLTDAIDARVAEIAIPEEPWTATMELLRALPVEKLSEFTPASRRRPGSS